jgi:hypothetical protein
MHSLHISCVHAYCPQLKYRSTSNSPRPDGAGPPVLVGTLKGPLALAGLSLSYYPHEGAPLLAMERIAYTFHVFMRHVGFKLILQITGE